jgi:hypothetical protein
VEPRGFEPRTISLPARRSPTELRPHELVPRLGFEPSSPVFQTDAFTRLAFWAKCHHREAVSPRLFWRLGSPLSQADRSQGPAPLPLDHDTRKIGADNGNQTRVCSLATSGSVIELYPHGAPSWYRTRSAHRHWFYRPRCVLSSIMGQESWEQGLDLNQRSSGYGPDEDDRAPLPCDVIIAPPEYIRQTVLIWRRGGGSNSSRPCGTLVFETSAIASRWLASPNWGAGGSPL